MDVTSSLDVAAAPVSRRDNRARWGMVIVILVGAIVNYLDRANLSIGNSTIAGEFHLSGTEMGLLLSAFLWPYAIANLPAGFLVDRFGPKKMFAFASGGWSLVTLLCAFVNGFGSFYALRVLLGISESPFFTSGIKVTNAWFSKGERGMPTAVFNTGSQIANAIAPPLLTGLMLWLGWRGMFAFIGVAGFVVMAVWLAIYRDAPAGFNREPVAPPRVGGPTQAQSWAALFRERSAWGMILGNFGIYFTVWIYLGWLPRYLETEQHMSLKTTGWIASIPFAAGVVGVLVGGWISDILIARGMRAINARKVPIVGGALLAACAVAPVPFVHDTTLDIVLLTLGYFAAQVPSGAIWALAADVAPAEAVGSLGAIQNFGGFLGAAIAPVITGYLLDVTGNFTTVFVMGALLLLGGACCYAFMLKQPIPSLRLRAVR